jgi:surfeit locus 1 family protein
MARKRPVPIVATLLVLAAAGTMLALGFWQLERRTWKNELLGRYEAAARQPEPVAFPMGNLADAEQVYFRTSRVNCRQVNGPLRAIGGHSAAGELGYVHIASCDTGGRLPVPVQIGWSRGPDKVTWQGGQVTGTIAPYDDAPARLIADPPQAGLSASQMPSAADIPNNHLSYAVQWFFFAGTSLIIYAIALRKRWTDR